MNQNISLCLQVFYSSSISTYMAHAKNKVWIHGIFCTKHRKPLITKELQTQVYENLHLQIKRTGCYLEAIGGIEDHVHLLFLLNRNKSVGEVFKQLKGASSREFNQLELFPEQFHWQKGYGAFSVSESGIYKVVQYISNQEIHHQKLNYDHEFISLLQKHHLPTEEVSFE